MKPIIKILAVFCAVLFVFAFSSCKKEDPPVPGSPDSGAEEYSGAEENASNLSRALKDIEELSNPSGVVRGVLSEKGLMTALEDKNNKIIRLSGEVSGAVTLAEGNWTDRSFIFDAADASVVCDADVGSITLSALNEDGFVLNGTAKTVYINGPYISLTLNNSVERLYISGYGAEVTLENGDFSVIYCDNVTDVIKNKTDKDVDLILPLGVVKVIPAGKAYEMETGKLVNAK